MPSLTCPACEGTFETSGIRYTGCPKCGVKIDTRSPDGPVVMTPQRKQISRLDDVDESMMDAPKSSRRSRPVKTGGGSNTDNTVRMLLVFLVGATVIGFLVVVGLFVVGWFVADKAVVQTTVTNSSTSMPSRPNEFVPPNNNGNNGGLPGVNPGQGQPGMQPGGPGGQGAGFGPPTNGGTSFPTPKGNLPGIDPAELAPPGVEQIIKDIEGMFPPGTFPPGTFPLDPGQMPGGPDGPGIAGPGGNGPPGFPGVGGPGGIRRPGMPGQPNFPGQPGVGGPGIGGPGIGGPGAGAAGVTVNLSNLRFVRGLNPSGELEVDYQNLQGVGMSAFQAFRVKTSDGTYSVRAIGMLRGQGTVRIRPPVGKRFTGPIEVTLISATPGVLSGDGQALSNTVSIGQ